jgi:hypothetical protein
MEIIAIFLITLTLSIIGGIVLAGAVPFAVRVLEWIEKKL